MIAHAKKDASLALREHVQIKNLHHAKYVCINGAHRHKWWSCKAVVWLNKELNKTERLLHPPAPVVEVYSGSATSAICAVFGSHCSEAIAVANCESTLNTGATNGQYQGLFQMGSNERGTYGSGSNAYTQAKAAYSYFVSSGSDWSPWACKPY